MNGTTTANSIAATASASVENFRTRNDRLVIGLIPLGSGRLVLESGRCHDLPGAVGLVGHVESDRSEENRPETNHAENNNIARISGVELPSIVDIPISRRSTSA